VPAVVPRTLFRHTMNTRCGCASCRVGGLTCKSTYPPSSRYLVCYAQPSQARPPNSTTPSTPQRGGPRCARSCAPRINPPPLMPRCRQLAPITGIIGRSQARAPGHQAGMPTKHDRGARDEGVSKLCDPLQPQVPCVMLARGAPIARASEAGAAISSPARRVVVLSLHARTHARR
jgi:hypothetical protein